MSATPPAQYDTPTLRAALAPAKQACSPPVETATCDGALSMARAAIARWRGAPLPPGDLPCAPSRVSPQARWLAQTQAGLRNWIADGGFAQDDATLVDKAGRPTLAAPVMYRLPSEVPAGAAPQATSCPIG